MDYVFGDKLSKDQLTVLRTRFDGIRAVLSEGVYDPSDCHGYVSREPWSSAPGYTRADLR